MYAKTITYKDYNNLERTETFYFNLTKTELAQLDMTLQGGLKSQIEKAMASKDGETVMNLFNLILSKSYGEKSLDGRRFVKSEELYKAFTETEAYNQFFFDLITDSKVSAEFVNGVISSVMNELPDDKKREAQNEMKKLYDSLGDPSNESDNSNTTSGDQAEAAPGVSIAG